MLPMNWQVGQAAIGCKLGNIGYISGPKCCLDMKKLSIVFLIIGSLVSYRVQAQTDPWMNPALPVDTRVHDLISRLTPEEKVYQMMNTTPAIPRLHIAEYDWWN